MSYPVPRVLVIEDEGLVAMALCDDLQSLKLRPVGPFGSLAEGLSALKPGSFELALVDINLKGEMSYPLVRALIEAEIPTAILTGYSDGSIPVEFSKLAKIDKPYSVTDLCEAIIDLLRARRFNLLAAKPADDEALRWP